MKKIIFFLKVVIINLFYKKEINYNQWVFSSSFNRKYNYNSKYLFEYVLKHHPEIHPVFVINDKKLKRELEKKIGNDYFVDTTTKDGIITVLNSGVWFTSAGLPIYGINLKKNRLIINLWHGVPLKKIALMEENYPAIKRLYFKKVFSENYTHIITTSKNLINIMRKSFSVDEDIIKVWGQPRNDSVFIDNDRNLILDNLYGTLPEYSKIILYAPTFRQSVPTVLFPFENFSEKKINKYLEENNLMLFIRTHQVETSTARSFESKRIKIINQDTVMDIMSIINIFDLLITDYSSIYIDYLLTKKPIMFLPYDKEEYLKSRGLNFEYDKVTPGPKPKTYAEFIFELDTLLNEPNYYKPKRVTTNNFFNEVGYNSSKKIVENIKNDLKENNYL